MKKTMSWVLVVLIVAVMFSHRHLSADGQFTERLDPVAAALH